MTPPHPTASFTAESIAVALEGRRYGRSWRARCPAHADKNPSLNLRDADDGRVLVICRSGCRQRDVIRALRDLGLWPRHEPLTPAERRAWALARRRAEAEARDCLAWYSTLCSDLESDKADAAGDPDPWPRFEPAARELARLTVPTPGALLAEYRRRSVREPRQTGRLVARGRALSECCCSVAGLVLRHWRAYTVDEGPTRNLSGTGAVLARRAPATLARGTHGY
jgi:hypothetical protein